MAALSEPDKVILELCEANGALGLYVVRLQSDLNEAKERIAELETLLSAARARVAELEGRDGA